MKVREWTGRATIRLTCGDCMDGLKAAGDNHWQLCIADPPYGIGAAKMNLGKWGGSMLEKKEWDDSVPTKEYFEEMDRVSVSWIVWGGNYFRELWPSRAFVVWDKGAGFRGRSFAEAELAATNIEGNAKVFMYDPLSGGDYRGKIHKTQKPVAIYKWLLSNYAKKGDRILDTHGGSMSIALACWDAGHDLDAWEMDEDYFEAACERIDRHVAQGQFDL